MRGGWSLAPARTLIIALLVLGLWRSAAWGQSLLEQFSSGLPGGGTTNQPRGEESEPRDIPLDLDKAAKLFQQSQEMLIDAQQQNGNAAQLPSATSSLGRQLLNALQGQTPAAESLPSPTESLPSMGQVKLPLSSVMPAPPNAHLQAKNGLVTLFVRDVPLSWILSELAKASNLNIVTANDVDAVISINLNNVPLSHALTAILSVANYTWTLHDDIIYVTSAAGTTDLPAQVQGREIQVFPLDYADSAEVLPAVTAFLSPVGQAFSTTSDEADNRKTQEVIVVEDLPHVVRRVAGFIHQVDQPPRQVLIEAHILQVDLKDDRKHGVDFEHMFSVNGNNVTIETTGFASAAATPAFFASVSGGNLIALIEALKSTTEAKTLASPKILVLNEQTARIQIGEQLGFRVTTTTETSTLESVDFLDVGVVLDVTPRISRDNRVLLNIRPEVSSGQVNPETGLPEEETTELSTSVILEDGYGTVIGGLIKEGDSVIQSKIPYVGDLWLVGRLFQRQEIVKDRSEIIVVLIPRVLPYRSDYATFEQGEVHRATTELFEGPLMRKSRPWNAQLPDAVRNPRQLRIPPVGKRYPWPAVPVEDAATYQLQNEYFVPNDDPQPVLNGHPGLGSSFYELPPMDEVVPSGPVDRLPRSYLPPTEEVQGPARRTEPLPPATPGASATDARGPSARALRSNMHVGRSRRAAPPPRKTGMTGTRSSRRKFVR